MSSPSAPEERIKEESDETSPPISPSRSMKYTYKSRTLVQFVVVFLLGLVTTLLHLRSGTLMVLIVGDQKEQLPNLEDEVNQSDLNNRLSLNPMNDLVGRQENTTAAPQQPRHHDDGDVSVLDKVDKHTAKGHLRNHSYVQRLHRHHREINHPSNLTLDQQMTVAAQLRNQSPIIAAGLPKSGTTSLHRYFQSIKQQKVFRSSHTYTHLPNGTLLRAGECMQHNVLHGKPMLQDCGSFQVWSDSGYAMGGNCFYPLWHALDAFVESYPNATIILNTRNATEWTRSFHKWSKGSLALRWNNCRNTPSLPKALQLDEWIHFYEAYYNRIRQACEKHSSLNCIEFNIRDERAGSILQENFLIPASNWQNCNPKGWVCS